MKLISVLRCISGLTAFLPVKEEKIEHSCLKECTFGLFRAVLKCYTLEECENQAMLDYWFSCLGEQIVPHYVELIYHSAPSREQLQRAQAGLLLGVHLIKYR